MGEEPPLSGSRGSGTVFLANCNLRCVFCQNADISQRPSDHIGQHLGRRGARGGDAAVGGGRLPQHQLGLTDPPGAALVRGARAGRRERPVGADRLQQQRLRSVAVLELLDGVVDIYMPDLKYAMTASRPRSFRGLPITRARRVARSPRCSARSATPGTSPPTARCAEGSSCASSSSRATSRGSQETLRWLSEALSPLVTVSLMSQYRPCHRAGRVAAHPRASPDLSAGTSTWTPCSHWSASTRALTLWCRGSSACRVRAGRAPSPSPTRHAAGLLHLEPGVLPGLLLPLVLGRGGDEVVHLREGGRIPWIGDAGPR